MYILTVVTRSGPVAVQIGSGQVQRRVVGALEHDGQLFVGQRRGFCKHEKWFLGREFGTQAIRAIKHARVGGVRNAAIMPRTVRKLCVYEGRRAGKH